MTDHHPLNIKIHFALKRGRTALRRCAVVVLMIVGMVAALTPGECTAQWMDKVTNYLVPPDPNAATPDIFRPDSSFTKNGQYFTKDGVFSQPTYEPTWTFGFGTVLYDRSDPGSTDLATRTSDSSTLINTDQFNPGYTMGYELYVRWSSHAAWDVKYRYLWIDDWDASASATDNANVNIPWLAAGNPYDTVASDFRTRLFSHELNAYLGGGAGQKIRPMIGMRWLELHEDGQMTASGGAVSGTLDVATRNYLYGTQTGVEFELLPNKRPDWLELDGYFTLGVFYSKLKSRSSATAALNARQIGDSLDHTSFLSDMGIRAGIRMGDHIRFYGGYQLLYIAGVAEAWHTYTASSPTDWMRRGCPLFHGATATFEFRW